MYTGTLVATYSMYSTAKLRNSIKMQSGSHLVRGAETTRCIALYQTLSRERVWLRETTPAPTTTYTHCSSWKLSTTVCQQFT